MRRLTLRAHLNNYTGYGEMTCQLFRALSRRSIFVSVRPTAVDEQWGKGSSVPTAMKAQTVNCRQPEPWELIACTPNTEPTPERRTIFYSMYESSELPPEFVHILNKAELVIVPCKWCKESFAGSGVKVPIEVIPLGYDPAVFVKGPPKELLSSSPIIFGVAGRTRHCARRKSVQEAIDLFIKTFPNDDRVRLHVKVHPDDTAVSNDHRVKIFKQHFEPYELAHWISGLNAFLTLSRGEGYGLWPLQCMAMGVPVIGGAHTGQADFMDDENSFLIKHRMVDADAGESNVSYLGQWASLDYKSAAAHMMTIRKRPSMAADVGEKAWTTVGHLTWQASADKLIEVLERVGAL